MNKTIRDRILEAAEEIFSRFGFKKTTMDEIAESLHKAKGSIYYYFKNKEDVFKSILEKESSLLRNEIKKAIDSEVAVEKKLEAYLLIKIKMMKKVGVYYQALKDEYLAGYSFIQEIRKEHFKNELRIIKNILTEGMKRGVFDIKQIEVTATTIYTTFAAMEYSQLIGNKSGGIKPVKIDNLLHIIFNGLIKR